MGCVFLLLSIIALVPWARAFRIPDYHCLRKPRPLCSTIPRFAWSRAASTTSTNTEETEGVTTTSSNKDQKLVSSLPKVPIGGDFAGLSATFDSEGKLIPIPEYLVPESLLEWGQAPSSLEVLVSEDYETETADDNNRRVWKRRTVTVLPETGCGVDNLETTLSVEEVDMAAASIWETDSLRTFCCTRRETTGADDDNKNTDRYKVETAFGLPDQHRARVVVEFIIARTTTGRDLGNSTGEDVVEYSIQSPLKVLLERRTDTVSSNGTIANGGGLDGRRVTRLMGETLRKLQSFAEEDVTAHRWSTDGRDDNDGLTFVNLPGNLTLAHGTILSSPTSGTTSSTNNQWILEMGQVFPQEGIRQVVRRMFGRSMHKLKTRIERIETKTTADTTSMEQ